MLLRLVRLMVCGSPWGWGLGGLRGPACGRLLVALTGKGGTRATDFPTIDRGAVFFFRGLAFCVAKSLQSQGRLRVSTGGTCPSNAAARGLRRERMAFGTHGPGGAEATAGWGFGTALAVSQDRNRGCEGRRMRCRATGPMVQRHRGDSPRRRRRWSRATARAVSKDPPRPTEGQYPWCRAMRDADPRDRSSGSEGRRTSSFCATWTVPIDPLCSPAAPARSSRGMPPALPEGQTPGPRATARVVSPNHARSPSQRQWPRDRGVQRCARAPPVSHRRFETFFQRWSSEASDPLPKR
jgi:hypothetical protein